MYKRIVELSGKHTFFLFGMRGTGKSTLLGKLFGMSNVMWIDLLLAEHDLKYKKNPDLLKIEISGLKDSGKLPDLVVIDDFLDTEMAAQTSNLVKIYSDTNANESDLLIIKSDTSDIRSHLVVQDAAIPTACSCR